MEKRIEVFTHNGLDMEYSIIGKGEPILVLHGGHSNCLEEFGYQALMERGYLIITPSRPGYGGTSREIGVSLASASEYYAALLSHLHISKVHIIAMSAGGPSGIYFAAACPELAASLTLQSAVTKEWLRPGDREYKAARILFRPGIEKYTWKMISTMNNLFPNFVFKQMFPSFSTLTYADGKAGIVEGDIEEVRKMNNRQRSGEGFFIDMKQVNEINVEKLQAVNCPALIMHSKNDGSVPVEHACHAFEHIESSELCLLDSWGHLIWIGKNTVEVNDQLVGFLKGVQMNRGYYRKEEAKI
ncbi:hydrolase [Mesobacillus campisalis]|uniref:Hydrolase n=1 Tax=Mesobacillus campisalis TaxID=1408103 RepID=A0A0M2SXU3_9BACI|nr:alpha/beta hydrolase [Mesobacillus campisalis]KKK37430.1 hydrolase [Mesobacillus campisalis]